MCAVVVVVTDDDDDDDVCVCVGCVTCSYHIRELTEAEKAVKVRSLQLGVLNV